MFTARIKAIPFKEFCDVHKNESRIIDVRSSAEYSSGHIEEAISLPYTRLKADMEEISNAEKLYVHCASGNRALAASSFLMSLDFDVVHLDGNLPRALCFQP
jgi:hydroxyacylglutathione hydrolase